MNFQIFRMQTKVPCQLTKKAKDMLKNSSLPISKVSFRRDQLLIFSSPYIPNQWCILIEKEGKSLSEWYKQVLQVWKNFQFSSLRIFLPQESCPEEWNFFLKKNFLGKKNTKLLFYYLKRITIVCDS